MSFTDEERDAFALLPWSPVNTVETVGSFEKDVSLLLKVQVSYNPCRLRVLITDFTRVLYEVIREDDINRRLQKGIQESQEDSQSQNQIFRNGARELQVRKALEEIQDALGVTDGGAKVLSRAARNGLQAQNRPVKAKLASTKYGIDLHLSTASLDFIISAEQLPTPSAQSDLIYQQLIKPLMGYAASAETLVDPPQDIVQAIDSDSHAISMKPTRQVSGLFSNPVVSSALQRWNIGLLAPTLPLEQRPDLAGYDKIVPSLNATSPNGKRSKPRPSQSRTGSVTSNPENEPRRIGQKMLDATRRLKPGEKYVKSGKTASWNNDDETQLVLPHAAQKSRLRIEDSDDDVPKLDKGKGKEVAEDSDKTESDEEPYFLPPRQSTSASVSKSSSPLPELRQPSIANSTHSDTPTEDEDDPPPQPSRSTSVTSNKRKASISPPPVFKVPSPKKPKLTQSQKQKAEEEEEKRLDAVSKGDLSALPAAAVLPKRRNKRGGKGF